LTDANVFHLMMQILDAIKSTVSY